MSLTESFWVRRLKPDGNENLVSDEEGELGVCVDLHTVPVPAPETDAGVKLVSLLVVLWTKTRAPAICYEDPNTLENLGLLASEEDEEELDEEDDEE